MNYKDYFPLASKKDVTGVYGFLTSEGYGEEVDCVNREGYNTNTRRLMIVGLIYDKKLLDKFLSSVWTQGNLGYRKDRMGIWNRRYEKRPDLHKC